MVNLLSSFLVGIVPHKSYGISKHVDNASAQFYKFQKKSTGKAGITKHLSDTTL